MSSQRSSSGVRNLRAIFEHNDQSSTEDSRGRSPAGSVSGTPLTSQSPSSIPNRRVRSSFVSVESSGSLRHKMSSEPISEDPPVSTKRPSLHSSTTAEAEATDQIRKAIVDEAKSRPGYDGANEDVVVSPGETTVAGTNGQSEHPDKALSAVEDEAILTSADPKDAATVAGANKTNGKLSKSRLSTASTTSRNPTRAAPLSAHLTAPTASSLAKHQAEPSSKGTAQPKKVREIPAHLLAPTAAFKAKHEVDDQPKPKGASSKVRDVPAHLLQPTASLRAKHDEPAKDTKPATKSRASLSQAPRASLGAAASARLSKPAASRPSVGGAPAPAAAKPKAAPSGDFLARMSKPTAASTKRTTEDKPAPSSTPGHKSRPSLVGNVKAAVSKPAAKLSAKTTASKPVDKTSQPSKAQVVKEVSQEQSVSEPAPADDAPGSEKTTADAEPPTSQKEAGVVEESIVDPVEQDSIHGKKAEADSLAVPESQPTQPEPAVKEAKIEPVASAAALKADGAAASAVAAKEESGKTPVATEHATPAKAPVAEISSAIPAPGTAKTANVEKPEAAEKSEAVETSQPAIVDEVPKAAETIAPAPAAKEKPIQEAKTTGSLEPAVEASEAAKVNSPAPAATEKPIQEAKTIETAKPAAEAAPSQSQPASSVLAKSKWADEEEPAVNETPAAAPPMEKEEAAVREKKEKKEDEGAADELIDLTEPKIEADEIR